MTGDEGAREALRTRVATELEALVDGIGRSLPHEGPLKARARRRARRRRSVAGVLALCGIAGLAFGVVRTTQETHTARPAHLTVAQPNSGDPVTFSVTSEVSTLPANGEPFQVQIHIQNNSTVPQTLVTGCGLVSVGLSSSAIPFQPDTLDNECLPPAKVLQPGETTISEQVDTTFQGCDSSGHPTRIQPECLSPGGRIPSLPPGRYVLTVAPVPAGTTADPGPPVTLTTPS